MPASLNGVPFDSWTPPATDAEWATVSARAEIAEEKFAPTPGKKTAAGCVIEEQDGRVWIVSPN